MNRVVVTGLGVVSPVGNDVATFWKNLTDGVCGIGAITKFDPAEFKVKIAAEVKGFDPTQYMPKSEVRKTDLYCQYALAAAAQAMADSGIQDQVDPERLGVYIGSGVGGINTFLSESDKLRSGGARKVSPFFIPMMIANIAAGNVAIKYNAQGPCVPIVTACATSTNTIGEAFRAIQHGYADAILAGGAEATINPLAIAGFTNCMALSTRNDPKSASIPFDKRRDGFVIGEGAGILVLEEYEHAKQRGAKIYAEIAGYGATGDAYHITSPAEDGSGAAKAMELAMEEGGIEPSQVDYINAHGTSTHHNDLFETRAIKLALGDAAKDVVINSTKSMIGHLLGAAGGVEFITCVKTIQDNFIHQTVGTETPDEECDLNYAIGAPVEKEVNYVLTNSLGFGGNNAVLLLKRYED